MVVLKVDAIHVYYGSIHALQGVSLTVSEGEIVTLIGGNGAGKTTTLNAISGIKRPRQGAVFFKGERIDLLRPHQIVTRGVCQAPEGRKIFGRLTVEENLQMGAFIRKDRKVIHQDMERLFQLFSRLGERRRQVAGTLSGGEQQMLAIGRALMSRPDLLLLDEPSMGLSPVLVEAIFEIISQISATGTTILLVEQNALMALSISHRGYVIQAGRIALESSAKDLLEDENVRRLYLGEEI